MKNLFLVVSLCMLSINALGMKDENTQLLLVNDDDSYGATGDNEIEIEEGDGCSIGYCMGMPTACYPEKCDQKCILCPSCGEIYPNYFKEGEDRYKCCPFLCRASCCACMGGTHLGVSSRDCIQCVRRVPVKEVVMGSKSAVCWNATYLGIIVGACYCESVICAKKYLPRYCPKSKKCVRDMNRGGKCIGNDILGGEGCVNKYCLTCPMNPN